MTATAVVQSVIPSASVTTAAAANPRLFSIERKATRRS